MGLLQNTWFVGISTGIISGILVFFLTKWIMDRKGKTEYYKQVANANHNVINALKPYIADQGLPTRDIFEALISSTSRELGVVKSDMYTVTTYCEELIREIMGDVYVSNEKKREYTNSLAQYRQKELEKKEDVFEIKKAEAPGTYANRMRFQMSLYVSGMAAILSMFSAVFLMVSKENWKTQSFWYPFDNNPILWLPLLLVVLILILAMSVVMMEMILQIIRRRKNLSEQQEKED